MSLDASLLGKGVVFGMLLSDLMVYKAAMNLKEIVLELEENELVVCVEILGKIRPEWEQDFWKRKLRREVRAEIMNRFIEDDE